MKNLSIQNLMDHRAVKGSRKGAFKFILSTVLLLLGFAGYANVTVTPASGGTNICSTVATSSTTLGTITIAEGASTDFPTGSSSITLAPPTGWQFVVSLPSVSASGGDVSIGIVSITSGSLTINFSASGTSNFDIVTISNLKVQATSSGSASGYIYASSDFGVAGITTSSTGTNFGSLSIQAAATPSVSIAVTPSSTICATSSATFTPTPTNGGASPTYNWFVNGSFVGSGPFFSTSTLTNGNTVNAIMTSSASCLTTATATSNTISMTVNALPTAVTVSGGGTFCGSTSLTAANGGSGTIYFQGTTSGGTSTSLGGSPQTITTSGTYYFRAQSAAGCWGTEGSAIATINTAATANAGSTQTVCAGGTVTLAGSIGGSATSSTWSAATGTFSNPSSLTSTYTPSISNGNVTLTLTTNDPDGAGPCTAATSTVVITVNPVPSATFVFGGGTFCNSTTLTAVGGGGGTIFFQGTTSGGTATTLGGSPQTITSSGTYYFRSETALGCWGTEGSATVTINTGATANAGGPQSVCAGGTVTLAGSIGGSATSSTWSAASGTFSSPSSLTSTYTPSIGSGVVTLTLTTNDPDGAGPCTAATSTVNITVNALPTTVTVTGGGTACGSATLTASNGGSGTIFYQGTTSGGTSTSLGGTPQIVSTSGTYYFRAQSAAGCWGNQGSATVTINPLPVSTFSVTGGGSYCTGGVGSDVGLSGSAAGFNYQLMNGASAVGSPMAGTGAPLDFGLQTTAGIYTVTGINPVTSCTVTMTGSANVSINALPIAFAVSGGGSYCVGGTGVAVTLPGSTSGISYQLYYAGAPTGSPVTGTGSAISFGLQTAVGTYSVVATNPVTSCTNNMTGSVTVSTTPLPTAFSVTGGGIYCSGGAGVNIGLFSSTSGVNYQLYEVPGIAIGSPVAGTGSAISFGLQTAVGTYTVQATNASTFCTNTMTGSAVVSTSTPPTVYTVTGGGVYCAGSTGVDVALTGSSTGVNYQLYIGGVPVGSSLAGTGSALDFGLQTATGAVTVIATDVTTLCTSNMTSSVTISSNPAPAAFSVTGGGSYCTGGAGLNVGLAGSAVGVSYQLYRTFVAVGSAVAGTGAAISFGLQTTAGFYTVVATDNSTLCTNNMTGGVAITVLPLPTAYNVTGGGSYCAGGTGVHVGTNNSDFGVSYQLYRGAFPVGSAITGTGLPIDFGLQTTAGTYTVLATDGTTTCSNTLTGSAVVSISPIPTVYTVTGGGVYCAGGAGVAVGLSNSDAGVNYQLYNGSSTTGSPVAGTGAVISFGLQTAAGTYTVVATNATSGCTNNMSGSVAVTINPLPAAFTVTGGGPYCAGGSGSVVGLSGSVSGVNYQLYRGATTVGVAVSGTGSAITFGSQTVAGTYSVVATDGSTGCTNAMTGAVTISINPLPNAYVVTGGGPYCAGGTGVPVGLTNSDAGVTYQLSVLGVPTGAPVAGTGSAITFGLQTTAGNYTVAATNGATGCSNAMTGSVTVSINALPLAFSVTGGGTMCAGAAGFHIGLAGSVAGVNYDLFDGATLMGSLAGTGSALDFGMFTTPGTYSVVATDGSTGCMQTMTGTATITVNPLPTVYNFTGGGSYCAGGTGIVDILSGSDVGVDYQEFIGAATIGSPIPGTGLPLFIVDALAGTYTIVATDALTGCSSNMTGSTTVTVNPVPSAISGVFDICIGATTTLSDTDPGGTWSSSNTSVATIGTGGNVSSVAAGTTTISYTFTSTGCAATATETVEAMPVVAAISGSSNVCIGGTTSLSDVTAAGAWSTTDITIATVSGSGVVTGIATGSATISYTVTSGGGCTTTVIKVMTVNAPPAAPTAITGATTVCAGSTISLIDSVAGGTWSSGNTSIATVNAGGTVGGVAAGSVAIFYTITNSVGCSSSVSQTITVGTAMPASALLPLGSATICHNNPVNLYVVTTGTGLTYQWTVGGGAIAGATDSAYTAVTPGMYSVILDNGTCSAQLATVNVMAPPVPVINKDTAFHFLYTGSFNTYQWYLNDSAIAGATSNMTPETKNGTYTVVVSDINGCFDTSAPFVDSSIIVNGVVPVKNADAIRIYPNPASSVLHIEAPMKVLVTIVSPDGRTLMDKKEAISLNIGDLANGMYMIMIYDEGKTLLKTDKFVKVE
jgi:hypothetical protein